MSSSFLSASFLASTAMPSCFLLKASDASLAARSSASFASRASFAALSSARVDSSEPTVEDVADLVDSSSASISRFCAASLS